MSAQIALHILPDDIHTVVDRNSTLRDIFHRLGIDIWYPCAGNGSCGKCKIHFISGAPKPQTSEKTALKKDELDRGFRLACQVKIGSVATIFIPEESRLRSITSLTSSLDHNLILQPALKMLFLKLAALWPDDLKSDEEILLAAPETKDFFLPLDILKKLPETLRKENFALTIIAHEKEILDILPGKYNKHIFGLAADIGTTTIAVSLIDLISGETLGVESALNPQTEYGDDLISRVSAIIESAALLLQLQQKVINAVNTLIRKLARQNNIKTNRIYQIVVSGNTVMNHIFSGVNPKQVALAPFTPVFQRLKVFSNKEFGLALASAGKVYVLPNIGGFVGGDVVADLLVSGISPEKNEKRLLIDIGTNCELLLKYKERCLAVSSPAGPALEGAKISQGMRAETGALSDVEIENGQLVYTTIGHKPARGICGSGLFRIIELLLKIGVIIADGRIVSIAEIPDKNWQTYFEPRIKGNKYGVNKVLLLSVQEQAAKDIYLTQQDVREFQLAKSAISTAWKMLLNEVSGRWQDLDAIDVAGAFGNFIRPETLQHLGVLPPVSVEKIRFIGNASLEGARMVLFNRENIQHSTELIRRVQFIELAGKPAFQELFVNELRLGNAQVSGENLK